MPKQGSRQTEAGFCFRPVPLQLLDKRPELYFSDYAKFVRLANQEIANTRSGLPVKRTYARKKWKKRGRRGRLSRSKRVVADVVKFARTYFYDMGSHLRFQFKWRSTERIDQCIGWTGHRNALLPSTGELTSLLDISLERLLYFTPSRLRKGACYLQAVAIMRQIFEKSLLGSCLLETKADLKNTTLGTCLFSGLTPEGRDENMMVLMQAYHGSAERRSVMDLLDKASLWRRNFLPTRDWSIFNWRSMAVHAAVDEMVEKMAAKQWRQVRDTPDATYLSLGYLRFPEKHEVYAAVRSQIEDTVAELYRVRRVKL